MNKEVAASDTIRKGSNTVAMKICLGEPGLNWYYISPKCLLVTFSQLLYCQERLLDFPMPLSWLEMEWTDCEPFVMGLFSTDRCPPILYNFFGYWLKLREGTENPVMSIWSESQMR